MRWVALLTLFGGLWQDASVQEPGLVIRSTTALVQVRVVAQDARGKPVADLQKDDFQVQDDRKTQPIVFFSAERGGALAPPDSAATIPAAQRAGEYSLILLDWVNTSYVDRYNARESVLEMLKQYHPRGKVAVYLLGKHSHLVWDFTNDMSELVQAIEEAGLDPENLGPESPPGRFDARYGSRTGPRLSAEEQLFFLNNRVNDSFETLQLMADRLARLPGRKSLIWLTAAFPLLVNGGVSYYPNMERLLARLNRADVAVYPVDARGLTVMAQGYPQTMEQISERTGGVMFAQRNDIGEGVRIALEDMRISYMIGFQVPANAAPGLHEIRVKVKRAGVVLRYRESYELR